MPSEEEANHSSITGYRDGNPELRRQADFPHESSESGLTPPPSPAATAIPKSGKRIRVGWWAAAGLVSLGLWYVIFSVVR